MGGSTGTPAKSPPARTERDVAAQEERADVTPSPTLSPEERKGDGDGDDNQYGDGDVLKDFESDSDKTTEKEKERRRRRERDDANDVPFCPRRRVMREEEMEMSWTTFYSTATRTSHSRG